MSNGTDVIEHDALDMIRQFGDEAARIARLRAEIAQKNIRNQRLSQT